jgi:hypothetical protein
MKAALLIALIVPLFASGCLIAHHGTTRVRTHDVDVRIGDEGHEHEHGHGHGGGFCPPGQAKKGRC